MTDSLSNQNVNNLLEEEIFTSEIRIAPTGGTASPNRDETEEVVSTSEIRVTPTGGTASPDRDETGDSVYSFFNSITQTFFYTTSERERSVVEDIPNFTPNGISHISADPLTGQAEEVYRYLDSATGTTFYTLDEREKEFIDDNLAGRFIDEGVAFHAFETDIGETIPIFRFQNISSGAFIFTPDEETVETLEQSPLYESNGVAYYAFPADL